MEYLKFGSKLDIRCDLRKTPLQTSALSWMQALPNLRKTLASWKLIPIPNSGKGGQTHTQALGRELSKIVNLQS